jgi:hypothetical protein
MFLPLKEQKVSIFVSGKLIIDLIKDGKFIEQDRFLL